MHNAASDASELSQTILDVERDRRYREFKEILANVLQRENALEILVELAELLPNLAFRNFMMMGVNCLGSLELEHYRKLFELSSGRDLATYNLTAFLVSIGGANADLVRTLSGDSPNVPKELVADNSDLGQIQGAEDRHFERLKELYGAERNDILKFRDQLRSLSMSKHAGPLRKPVP